MGTKSIVGLIASLVLLLAMMPAIAAAAQGPTPSDDEVNAIAKQLYGKHIRLMDGFAAFHQAVRERKLKSGVRINLDIAGYKQRRQEELHNLALRIAELVKSTRRAITLEPMSPSERRVVHLALRDDPEVITQSMGEEENRKVIVSLRRR